MSTSSIDRLKSIVNDIGKEQLDAFLHSTSQQITQSDDRSNPSVHAANSAAHDIRSNDLTTADVTQMVEKIEANINENGLPSYGEPTFAERFKTLFLIIYDQVIRSKANASYFPEDIITKYKWHDPSDADTKVLKIANIKVDTGSDHLVAKNELIKLVLFLFYYSITNRGQSGGKREKRRSIKKTRKGASRHRSWTSRQNRSSTRRAKTSRENRSSTRRAKTSDKPVYSPRLARTLWDYEYQYITHLYPTYTRGTKQKSSGMRQVRRSPSFRHL